VEIGFRVLPSSFIEHLGAPPGSPRRDDRKRSKGKVLPKKLALRPKQCLINKEVKTKMKRLILLI
jgi:hypothetical protein